MTFMKGNMRLCCLMSIYKKDNVEWVEEAIKSVVNQTKIPDEFLIVGDGPLNDDLQNLINSYSEKFPFIRFITYPENKGLWFALKYGVEKTECELIARMDSDDICDNRRFELEFDEFQKNPSLTMVGSNTVEFENSIDNVISTRKMPLSDEEIKKYLETRNPFIHSSVMFTKGSCLKAGNYQNSYLCEDYDLWARMFLSNAVFKNIDQNLVYMRVDKNFYKRRGGLKYVKAILKLKKFLYKNKISSFKSYFISSLATLVIGLCPNFIREFFYKRFLRS